MSTIKNIALAGAAGSIGSVVLQKLIADPELTPTVLRRTGSKSTFPDGVNVIDVDYNSVEALTAALKSQQALVMTMSTAPDASLAQIPLIEAATAAGVNRVIPAEFGSNMLNELVVKLPVFGEKIKSVDLLLGKAEKGELTYTRIFNGALLDWGIDTKFFFNLDEPFTVGDGNNRLSATSIDTVANAIVSVFHHVEQTKNKALYIEDLQVTQNDILEMAKKAAPEREWSIKKKLDLDELQARSDEQLAKGEIDHFTMIPYLWRSMFDARYELAWKKNDNAVLELKTKNEDYFVAHIQSRLR
ncbi:NAD(P)H-binding domain-containing protein [Sarocladium implicatum]|nr:NAD(P)H-binding domain-containing protein [Sarocladium implicatum]